MSQQALGPAGRAGPSKARETKISAPKTTQTAYAGGAKPAKTAPAASTLTQTKTPAAPSVPRQYTNNTVLNPPAAQSPAASPAPARPTPANSAGGTYNAAANRFTAPVDPQVRREQERARAEADHAAADALRRQNNALAAAAQRQRAETDHTAAQRTVRTDPRANGSAVAAQYQQSQTSGYDFNPYDYSPDADLYAQVTGTNFNQGTASLRQWWQQLLSSAQSTPANDAGGTNDPNTAQRQAGRETIAGVAPAQAGKQVQPSPGYDFDPYDYSPDADLSAQVAGTVFNAGKADVNRWLQSQRPPVNTAPAPGDTRSRDERDAQDILGVGSTYTYTGDPEDVARQMWAESGVTNAAEFRDAEEYFGRSIVGGTLDTLRDTANDISRRSQLSIPEQQAENAYWGAVAGDRGEMDKVYREYLSSLSPDERDALEITGQLMSPEAVYYLHVNQREQEKHKNDRLVNAVDWGIRYNQETQRIAEEKGLSEKTLQEGSFYRSFGRSLPAAALSLTGGAGAGLVSAEAANLIIGASRVLSGSLTFHSAAGNAYEDAIQGGADPRSAMNYATAVGAVELFTESMVSGMGRLGGRALGLGAPGTQLAESFARRIAQDPVAREMILSTCNVLGEGVEEFLSELGGYFADRIFLKQDQRSFVQALRDAGDSVLPAMMTSTLFEFNTLLLEGLDARQAAALAPEMIVEDLLQRAGLEDADTDRSNDGQTGRQTEGSAQTRSWTDGPRGPIPEDSPSTTYFDLQTLQTYDKMERASGGTGLLDRKPPYSPALRRWFRQGGTLEIRVENGHDIWTYTAPGGERCSYVDGNIRFSREHMYSDVGEINIGSFTTRAADRQKAIQILKADYAMKSVPSGYVLHHDSVNGVIQLVQKDIHSMFTHRGGFSIFVTNGGR